MGRKFEIDKKLVWCNDTQRIEKRLEVICGITTNAGTVLVERRAFAKTMPEAFGLRHELDEDCRNELMGRAL